MPHNDTPMAPDDTMLYEQFTAARLKAVEVTDVEKWHADWGQRDRTRNWSARQDY